MEDAPAKPDPAPVRRAISRLGACDPWMIGDTPDDIRAATGAGVQGVGIDGDDLGRRNALLAAGASMVLSSANLLADILL
jgi:histidinol-phosphate aminotransferase